MPSLYAGLSDLYIALHDLLFIILLYSARIFSLFSILQATSSQVLQGRMRSGVALLFAYFVAAGQPVHLLDAFGGLDLFLLALKEAFLGILLGYMAATAFWVVEGVGAMIDNVAGYNNVQQQNPLSTHQSTPISSILLQLCITLFYSLGGFLFLLDAVFETYRWWPVAAMAPVPAAILERFIILQTDTLMVQIVKISSPLLVVMVLIDLGFGLVAKTAGKLEPNSLAQPVKSATSILIVMLSLNVFIQQLTVSLSLADLKQQLQTWANVVAAPR